MNRSNSILDETLEEADHDIDGEMTEHTGTNANATTAIAGTSTTTSTSSTRATSTPGNNTTTNNVTVTIDNHDVVANSTPASAATTTNTATESSAVEEEDADIREQLKLKCLLSIKLEWKDDNEIILVRENGNKKTYSLNK